MVSRQLCRIAISNLSALNERALFFHHRSERLDSSVRCCRERNNRFIAESRMHGAECTSRSCQNTRNTLFEEEGSFDSQNRCKIANAGDPAKVPYISKINILVVTIHSFTLLSSCCYSVFILSVDFAGGDFFWRCSIQQVQRVIHG
jgi:hypothetical protein